MNYPVVVRRVVIVGIILAGVIFSGQFYFWGTWSRAKDAYKDAYIIHLALLDYSVMHDGDFPTAEHTSNEAFRELFKAGLIDDEKRFFVKGSAWHGGATAPDGKIGNKEDGFAEALGPGENHWAYTSGLNANTSDRNIPIIMDGFTDVIGTWCDDPTTRGGVWKGRYQLIWRVGVMAKRHDEIKESQALLDLVKTVPGAKLLNPDPPK